MNFDTVLILIGVFMFALFLGKHSKLFALIDIILLVIVFFCLVFWILYKG